MRSKLIRITVRNIGCIGPEGVTVELDDVLCLVGPNNSGKTTILRAYELAANPSKFNWSFDRCNWSKHDEISEVELDVHIPPGMANVDEAWKFQDGQNLVVRSRWQWEAGKFNRQTFDPVARDWAIDGKAGGADNVFTARLPRPMRIGSLDDAISTEDVLLTLALAPFIKELKALEADETSTLSKSKTALADTVNELGQSHEERLEQISGKIRTGFQNVFPGLGIRLNVAMPAPELKLENLLKQGSAIHIDEPSGASRIAQQGTGARRALFWSMLQVHNEMNRQTEVRDKFLKSAAEEFKKETKKRDPDKELLALLEQQIQSVTDGGPLPEDADDPALPGYILLMDEPENALHPMAARAAQRHLYALGKNPDWQVLITTHSPYFINPLEDHTTIARLERSSDGRSLSPRVYIADTISFTQDETDNLKALQLMDVGFSEMFFGSYPIIVEGDTENAAFLAAVVEADHVLQSKVSLIRARGKAILVPLMKMLRHFKAAFGVVHDIDWPLRSDKTRNGMWTVNSSIRDEVVLCRQSGLTVRHRWSVPDFERFLGGAELGKDKPYAAYNRVTADDVLQERVRNLIQELYDGSPDPADYDAEQDFAAQLDAMLREWAAGNGQLQNVRLGS